MAKYAADTSVPVDRSKSEIESLVIRYGATGYVTGWANSNAMIAFEMRTRRVRFTLPLPAASDKDIVRGPSGRHRSAKEAGAALQQAHRSRWRAFVLVIKAKLESVESGIRTFEQEFLNDIVTASGMTIGEMIQPKLLEVAETGKLPLLLPGPKS